MRAVLFLTMATLSSLEFVSALRAEGNAPIPAYIVIGQNSSFPKATCVLPALKASEESTIKIDLHNATKTVISFDRVRRSCNCAKITPEKGSISPGDSLTCSVKLTNGSRPSGDQESFQLFFADGNEDQFLLTAKYPFSEFIGFGDSFCAIDSSSAKEGLILFRCRIRVTNDIQLSDFRIDLSSAGTGAEVKIDEKNQSVVGSVPKENVGKLKSSELRLIKISSGELIDNVPFLVDGTSKIKLVPGHARFTRPTKESWVCSMYVKLPVDSVTRKASSLQCTGVDPSVSVKLQQLSDKMWRMQLTASDRERSKSIKFKLVHGSNAEEFTVPAIWIGE